MLINIDFESDTPIYTQLRNQIVKGIALGSIENSEELPSVRQMANDIGVNMHTVNKAYSILKQEGFIKLDRRKGAVIDFNFSNINEYTKEKLPNLLNIILSEAYCRGISENEIIGIINEIYNSYKGKGE